MITNIIKTFREKKGFTQEFVAGILGISRQTYSKIEKGESELSLGNAVKLSELFSIDLDELSFYDNSTLIGRNIDFDKYRQIIKTCITLCSDSDGKITKTKLAKLCYLADFARYYNNLSSMTNLIYRKFPFGPVPDVYLNTIERLLYEESIFIQRRGNSEMIGNIEQESPTLLTEEEYNLIKKICEKWKGKPTNEIVKFTHNQLPWSMCEPMEEIPYAFITQEDPDNVF